MGHGVPLCLSNQMMGIPEETPMPPAFICVSPPTPQGLEQYLRQTVTGQKKILDLSPLAGSGGGGQVGEGVGRDVRE